MGFDIRRELCRPQETFCLLFYFTLSCFRFYWHKRITNCLCFCLLSPSVGVQLGEEGRSQKEKGVFEKSFGPATKLGLSFVTK